MEFVKCNAVAKYYFDNGIIYSINPQFCLLVIGYPKDFIYPSLIPSEPRIMQNSIYTSFPILFERAYRTISRERLIL